LFVFGSASQIKKMRKIWREGKRKRKQGNQRSTILGYGRIEKLID
jgi:hypothetical protein